MKQFPDILRTWQGERTLTEAAKALNVGVSTFHAYLAGTTFPTFRRVGDLAARIGITEPELHEAIARTRAKRAETTPARAHPTIEGG
jgi:hypothetical protein